MPLKAMVFVDGNWLYRNRPALFKKLEEENGFEIDYCRMPKLLVEETANRLDADIDVVRTLYFGTVRAMYNPSKQNAFYDFLERRCGYETHVHYMDPGTGSDRGELQWVNMELGAEMLHYAMTPGVYDIAVLVGDDIIYAPVLRRVRAAGKRVLIVNSRPETCDRPDFRRLSQIPRTNDFPEVFLDDYANELKLVREHTVRTCRQCGREEETTWAGVEFFCSECRGKYRSSTLPAQDGDGQDGTREQ